MKRNLKTFMPSKLRITALVTLLLISCTTLIIVQGPWFKETQRNIKDGASVKVEDVIGSSFLDGCLNIYLDIGSNVGIQIRKLFEPELFSGAKVLKVFEEAFGKRNKRDTINTCAIGFEPNPVHSGRLHDIETSYRECGWSVKFFTETAVGHENKHHVDFFTDEEVGKFEWGAGVVSGNNNLRRKSGSVQMIRLADFINNIVAKRKVPTDTGPPTVIMKMDIEGSEIETLSDLLITGAMMHINKTMVEFHQRLSNDRQRRQDSEALEKGLVAIDRITGGKIGLIDVDDEAYFNASFPLPSC